MRDWPIRTIAECAADEPYSTQIGPFGKALTPDAYVPEGVPLLRGVNVNSGRFHDDDYVFISEADADRLSKFESFPGDVLLVHKGSLGQIGLMPEQRRYPRYIMGNSMLRVKCDPTKLLPAYLRYWLQSPEGQHYLFSRVSQVGVPQIQRPLTTLREAALPVPPISEQEAITDVLGSLDNKIEQNQRTAVTLKRLARAIFRAWFVDFEPVKAKAAGATEFLSIPQHIFDALPSAFVESELGSIPQGWTVREFGELFSLEYGKPLKAENRRFGEHPVLGSNGQIGWHDEALVPNAGIVIGRKGNPGTVLWVPTPFYPIDTTFYVVRKQGAPSLDMLYYFLDWAQLGRLSADSAVPGLNRNFVHREQCIIPQNVLVDCFAESIAPVHKLIHLLDCEARKLSELRDYMLLHLLSGKVRVRVRHG